MKHATSTLTEPLTPSNEAGTSSAPGRAAAASPSVLPAFDGLADLAGYQRDAFER